MRILFICNTYYQLILGIHMRQTIFKGESVDISLSDNSLKADEIARRLDECQIFSNVFYVEKKGFTYKQSKLKNVKDIYTYNLGRIPKMQIELYDEIIFYNLELDLYEIADYYKKIGHRVRWSKFEEGILSYDTDFSKGVRISATRFLRRITKRTDVAECVNKYYCFFPEIKETHTKWEMVSIPLLEKNEAKLRDVLNYIFDYEPNKYPQKYIFFASSSDIDGHPFGETELVLKIADEVGVDNLLVKMHPRDDRTVYEDYGISVLRDSYIPWEVMQLNNVVDEVMLLTIHSGAFLSISAIMNQETKGRFLFERVTCEDNTFNRRSQQIATTLDKLHKMNKCQNICIAESI